jgi:hypothetical protein
LHRTAHETKEGGKKKERKNPPAVSTPSCLTRGAAPFLTKPKAPIPGLDVKRITAELLPSRLNFLLLL